MKELLAEVQASVFMEYQRASAQYGPANHSQHESYAIILEEFDEAQERGAAFAGIKEHLWKGIKANYPQDVMNSRLRVMRENAEHAAAEWIQVAAMCYKATKQEVPSAKG